MLHFLQFCYPLCLKVIWKANFSDNLHITFLKLLLSDITSESHLPSPVSNFFTGIKFVPKNTMAIPAVMNPQNSGMSEVEFVVCVLLPRLSSKNSLKFEKYGAAMAATVQRQDQNWEDLNQCLSSLKAEHIQHWVISILSTCSIFKMPLNDKIKVTVLQKLKLSFIRLQLSNFYPQKI